MYHSITFGDKNTWTDWHLVPTSRPVIAPPKPKTQYVDIPGADGSIDLTESLAGRPVFSNREGTLEFIVLNDFNVDDYNYNWIDVYTDILQYLHGRSMRMILEDDPKYYYEGRFEVNSWTSDANNSKISINYIVSPYKYLIDSPITASDLELGNFGRSGTEGQSDFRIMEVASTTVARLKAPPKAYAVGNTIRVDSLYRFNLALYSGTAESPIAKKFITSSAMDGNSYTFMDNGFYRFEIYSMDNYSGVQVTDEDLPKMAASVHFYAGGIL